MKKIVFLSLVVVCALTSLKAQDLFSTATPPEKPPAPILQNIDSRNIHSLNGTWHAMIDPAVFSLNDLLHFAERNYQPKAGELVEVDLENGLILKVPGDWNTQDDRLFFYQGKVWYKRDFYVEKSQGQRYYLHFGAINYRAEVYVNGTLVGTHTGGYTSFNCEVTEQLTEGSNLLVVKVNNTLASAANLNPLMARKVMLDNMSKIQFYVPNDKPFVFSEFGAGAKRALKGSSGELEIFSEAYQATVYQKQIELIKNQIGQVGTTPWILKDFRSPMRLKQGVQDYWNLKGLISDNG
jgi:hypothetical protein